MNTSLRRAEELIRRTEDSELPALRAKFVALAERDDARPLEIVIATMAAAAIDDRIANRIDPVETLAALDAFLVLGAHARSERGGRRVPAAAARAICARLVSPGTEESSDA